MRSPSRSKPRMSTPITCTIRPELTLAQREFETNLTVKLFYTDFRRSCMPANPYGSHWLTYEDAFTVFSAKPWGFYHRRARLAAEKILELLGE
jgi:hypothetical protein